MNLTICEQLKLHLKRNKIKSFEVAEYINISPSNFSRRLNANSLKCDEIDKICEKYGFNITINDKNI